MVQVPVKSGFPVNVANGPVVATLGPASIVPVLESVANGLWPLAVAPTEFVKIVVVEPRESVVVSLGHPTKNGVVTLTFPQTCELKFSAASDRLVENQGRHFGLCVHIWSASLQFFERQQARELR